MASTMKDISKQTGLALSTISKYINGGNVLSENKALIDEAIKSLDFEVNQFAQSLKTNKSKTIGIIIPELNASFYTTIIAYIDILLRREGYGIIICGSGLSKENEINSIKFVINKKVDGIIIVPLGRSREMLSIATKKNIPIVLLDRLIKDFNCDSVIIDNENASVIAINEFISFGHKKIGILCGSSKIYTMGKRLDGYKLGLENNNIKYNDEYVVDDLDMTISGGHLGLKKLMALKNPPSAIFCVNYEITLGAVIAINELGLKIAKNISLIGFDSIELSKLITPKLTIIMQPMQEMAEKAVEIMLSRINGDLIERTVCVLNGTLEKGKSIKKYSS